MTDCIFCKIVAKDIPSKVVYEDDKIIAFEDINPQAPVHIVLIPKKHIETLNDFSADDHKLMGHILMKVPEVAEKKGIREKGYRLVMNCLEGAGQVVMHIHFHILGGRGFHWPPG